ncbi:LysE family translocator [Herbaspirillum sp. HC18]|nr:LysE family translocator [Herbaspirillum sp. HC18]
MNWQEFAALLTLATATSFTPGPNTMLSTALAANFGLKRALRFVLAVPVGWGLLLTACAGGLGALIVTLPLLRLVIKAFGIGYLLWLALRLSRSAQLAKADDARMNVSFWQGVLLQFVNIKAWMLALTIVAGWIAGTADAMQRFALVLPVMLCFGLASNFTYALTGSLLREWLAHRRRLLVFNRMMALLLVGTAGWMAMV